MKYYIITGTSRGIGKAIAERLVSSEHHLICISRSNNPELTSKAARKGGSLDQIEFDLQDTEQLEQLTERIFNRIDCAKAESINLINNAGMLQPIAPTHKNAGGLIARNITVNLISPMILTSNFIRKTESLNVDKRILNISSGAGRRAFYGWSSYCSAKAGLDHFTRCVALEQADKEYGVKIVSLAPGVIDTDMQTEIRATSEEDFILLSRFVEYKETGQLLSPEQAAERILNVLSRTDFGVEQITELRDYDFS